MSDGRGTLRAIAWQEIFPSLILLRVFRLAISVRVLLLASVAVLLMTAGWWAIGQLFSGTDDPALRQWIGQQNAWPWQARQVRLADADTLDDAAIYARSVPYLGERLDEGPVFDTWRRLADPFWKLFSAKLAVTALAYLVLCCLWAVAVWALLGGAITRIAALKLARNENLPLGPALAHARSNWFGYFFAPLMPLIGSLVAVVPLVLLGLVMKLNVGVLLAGILWPLVLLAGLLLAILLVGLLFGWPLMWPTIGSEADADAFEALSRSYAYTYQKPLHYLGYVFIATLLGILGVLVVNLFAALVIYLSGLAISWGTGADRAEAVVMPAVNAPADHGRFELFPPTDPEKQSPGWAASAGAGLITFWTNVVRTVEVGFRYAFFWVAATAIYLLLRYHVDGAEMDQVSTPDQQPTEPLPALSEDAAGVPGVAEDPPSADRPDQPNEPDT